MKIFNSHCTLYYCNVKGMENSVRNIITLGNVKRL